MTKTRKIQKIFYFTNEETKNFIESRVEDIAVKEQRSATNVIERLLLNSLLPENWKAKEIIIDNLYCNSADKNVKSTLIRLFSENANGVDWKAVHNNFNPLVEFCIKYCDMDATLSAKNEGRHYFISKLESVVESIENGVWSCIEEQDKIVYNLQLKKSKKCLEQAKKNPELVSLKECFEFVYCCFDMLNDWAITYRYLYSLATMCQFREDEEARNELYDVISEMSKEW